MERGEYRSAFFAPAFDDRHERDSRLLIDPGKRLIEECINFSKRNQYQKVRLWTQSILLEARHLYVQAGFELVEESPHTSFGHDLIAEFWELPLP